MLIKMGVFLFSMLLISDHTQAQACSGFFGTTATKKTPVTNWTFENGNYPDFANIKPSDLQTALEQALKESKEIIQKVKAEQNPTFQNVMEPLEFGNVSFKRFDGLFEFLENSFSTPEFQKVEKALTQKMEEFETAFWMDAKLFEKIEKVYEQRDQLAPDQRRLVEVYRKRFINNGLHLTGSARERFIAIKVEIADLNIKYKENIQNSRKTGGVLVKTKAELKGLSEATIKRLAIKQGKKQKFGYRVPLEPAIVTEVLEKAENRELRRRVLIADSHIAQGGAFDNEPVVKKIAELRQEFAEILGYRNFADYTMHDKMVKNLDNAKEFIDNLVRIYRPHGEKEAQNLSEFAKSKTGNGDIKVWDVQYWEKRLLKEKYSFDERVVSEYLEFNRVQKGMFEVATRLYGLKFRERKDLPKPDPTVQVFEVRSSKNELLAYFVVDPYTRVGTKKSGAWMFNIFPPYKSKDHHHTPILTAGLNLSKPQGNNPTLMKVSEVVVMFHEFGHALHNMVSTGRYPRISGSKTDRDFTEFPSLFMENFVYQKEVLQMFAFHYKTGEMIPDHYIDTIVRFKQFAAARLALRQFSFNLLDLAWHSGEISNSKGSLLEIEERVVAPTTIYPNDTQSLKSANFLHIFPGGYSALYYTYKWAEVLDADAFSIFKKEGIFNPDTADRFRKTILSAGNSKDPMDMYIDFAGRKPDINPMLERDGFKQ